MSIQDNIFQGDFIDTPKVLIIDDEVNVLKTCKRILKNESCTIKCTTDPVKAVQMIKDPKQNFAVIISDQRMPSMNGTQVLAKAKEISPDTMRIILTGYTDMQSLIEAVNRGSIFKYITKPWAKDEFLSSVRNAISLYTSNQIEKRTQEANQKKKEELETLTGYMDSALLKEKNKTTILNNNITQEAIGGARSLFHLLKCRMPEVAEHSKRVANLALNLGSHLKLSNYDLFQLEIACLLHEIGHLSLNQNHIYKKVQRQQVQQLTLAAEEVVKNIPSFKMSAKIIRHQFERFDGQGAPDQLNTDKIPMGSKILAVADAYDLELNKHSLANPRARSTAINHIKNSKSKYFDPYIVNILDVLLTSHKNTNDREIEISADELSHGMELSRDLQTLQGVILIPRNTKISIKHDHILQKIVSSPYLIMDIYVCKPANIMYTSTC